MIFEDVYNLLMFDVERDLCTDMLPTLDEKYANESEADRAVRMQRYADAWEQFEQRMTAFMGAWGTKVKDIKQQLQSAAVAEDAGAVTSILSQIQGL